MALTLPASPDHELSLRPGRVKWVVFGHGEGLVGNAVHVEGHAGDVHVEDVVMPFLIADLRGAKGRVRARMSAFLSSRHNNDSDTTGYGDRITHNEHLSSQEESLFFF